MGCCDDVQGVFWARVYISVDEIRKGSYRSLVPLLQHYFLVILFAPTKWSGPTTYMFWGARAKVGQGPKPAPRWLGNILATVLTWLGPKGLEFARYSIDYHYVRNWLYVMRYMGEERASRHVPAFARRIVQEYDAKGAISKRWADSPFCLGLGIPRLESTFFAPLCACLEITMTSFLFLLRTKMSRGRNQVEDTLWILRTWAQAVLSEVVFSRWRLG